MSSFLKDFGQGWENLYGLVINWVSLITRFMEGNYFGQFKIIGENARLEGVIEYFTERSIVYRGSNFNQAVSNFVNADCFSCF